MYIGKEASNQDEEYTLYQNNLFIRKGEKKTLQISADNRQFFSEHNHPKGFMKKQWWRIMLLQLHGIIASPM